jgi:hypothetical protein
MLTCVIGNSSLDMLVVEIYVYRKTGMRMMYVKLSAIFNENKLSNIFLFFFTNVL